MATEAPQGMNNAREPDHSICMVKEAKRSVGIRLTFLHFGVYALTGDMRRYHCSVFLTFS